MKTQVESARPFLLGVCAFILALLLWALRDLVMLVGYSVLIAYALDPIVSAVELRMLPRRRRIGRGTASAIVMLAIVLLAAWLLSFTVPRLAAEIRRFVERAPGTLERLVVEARAYAAAHGLAQYLDPVIDGARANASELLQKVGTGLVAWVARLFGGLGQLLDLALLPLLAFYLLADRAAVRASALEFVPEEARARLLSLTRAVDRALRSYVRGQALVCIVMGTAVGVVLAALTFPVPLLLGVTAGLAEIVPYLGFLVAALAIGLTGFGLSPLSALLGVAAYAVVNWLIGTFVTPRVMGRHLKMHPFVVTVSVLAGAELLGPAGAILALPGAAVIQALIGEWAARPEGRGARIGGRRDANAREPA